MVVATYTADLIDICLMETGDTFEEFSGYTQGDNAALETDWYLQGSSCASDEANNKTGVGHSIGYDNGSNISFGTGYCFFGWMMCMAGNAMDTFANGGYRVLIGSSTSDYNGWVVGGSDFGRNPYGGWVNVAVDPLHTADYTLGTPSGYRHFAVAFNLVSGISKGRPLCADSFRYGRGSITIAGGDLANGYATFANLATQNDSSSNRWGLFQEVAGGYLWKGGLRFGSVMGSCDFRDKNVNIVVDDTPKTYANFNFLALDMASNVEWTAIQISSLGTLSKGALEVTSPHITFTADSCTFTDMSTFDFNSGCTLTDTIFRRCGEITQNGATFDSCTVEHSTYSSALSADSLEDITDCSFISDGTGHAIDLGTVSGTTSVSWANSTTGFASTDGSTGNEGILVNVNTGSTLTINVSSGYGTPTVYNTGTGDVAVQNTVNIDIHVIDAVSKNDMTNARVLLYTSDDVDASNNWTSVAGADNTLGVMGDGTMWVIGDNSAGQLGLGDTTNRETLEQVGTAGNWDKVCSWNGGHSLAIKTDGTLWASGGNTYGQLGQNNTTDTLDFTQVGTATNWVSAACGDEHSLGINADGELWAFGRNNYGQLGLGDYTYRDEPTQVGTDTYWSDVEAGAYHTIAVTTSGTVWTTGLNIYGQLGHNDTTTRNTFTQVGVGTNWSIASAGDNFCALLTTSGTLWAFGYNFYGQLGYADYLAKHLPTQMGVATNWEAIHCGANHTIALTTLGTIYSTGRNDSGQFAQGNTTQLNTLTQIGIASSWDTIACGTNHTMIIDDTDDLWVAGDNSLYQLSTGDTNDRTSLHAVTISGTSNIVDILYNGLTDSNGDVSLAYNYTSDVEFAGRVRKSSVSPYYKPSNISGTITSYGFSTTILMIEDQ